jgi:hypothetical protein
MKAALAFESFPRSGPTLAVEPAAASVWQPEQPAEVKICSPLAASPPPPPPVPPPPPPAASYWSLIQLWNSPAGTTRTNWRIVECPSPHSSAHTTS